MPWLMYRDDIFIPVEVRALAIRSNQRWLARCWGGLGRCR